MNNKLFNELLDRRIELTRKVLAGKANEYASDTDRLHNFKDAVGFHKKGTTTSEALWGMLVKHLVSIKDLVHSKEIPAREMADEKLGDAINYLILLEAVWEDERPDLQNILQTLDPKNSAKAIMRGDEHYYPLSDVSQGLSFFEEADDVEGRRRFVKKEGPSALRGFFEEGNHIWEEWENVPESSESEFGDMTHYLANLRENYPFIKIKTKYE